MAGLGGLGWEGWTGLWVAGLATFFWNETLGWGWAFGWAVMIPDDPYSNYERPYMVF